MLTQGHSNMALLSLIATFIKRTLNKLPETIVLKNSFTLCAPKEKSFRPYQAQEKSLLPIQIHPILWCSFMVPVPCNCSLLNFYTIQIFIIQHFPVRHVW